MLGYIIQKQFATVGKVNYKINFWSLSNLDSNHVYVEICLAHIREVILLSHFESPLFFMK